LTDIEVSLENIVDIIKTVDPNKSSGPDGISHRMLKLVANKIEIPLSILFNESLTTSVFPDSWKLAHVIPIFKKRNTYFAENYRPISLLSCVGKVFERVVFKYIYNYMLDLDLLYKLQSGFLPNHSTTHQLIDMYHLILVIRRTEIYCTCILRFFKNF